jgi:hypothetical protein
MSRLVKGLTGFFADADLHDDFLDGASLEEDVQREVVVALVNQLVAVVWS